jgi:hypothetical protein
MIFSIFLFMDSHNVRLSLGGMTSLMFFATASLLGFTSVIPTAVASPIDDAITTSGATTTAITMSDDNTSLNVTTATNVELEEEPFAVGRYTPVIQNLINETQQVQIALEGSTTITLPNSTETTTTRDTGEGFITSLPGGGVMRAQIQMSTEDGSESVTVDLTEYHLDDEVPTAISLAYFSTNSTGMMAPLNNMIAVSLDEEQPNGDVIVRFFEWDVGRAPTAIGSINNTTIGG